MSTPEPSSSPGTPAAPPPKEIRIYSHSALFYWWPVWVFGFFASLWTLIEDNRMAIVPKASVFVKEKVTGADGKESEVGTIFLNGDGHQMKRNLVDASDDEKNAIAAKNKIAEKAEFSKIRPRVSSKAWLGPMFIMILCLVVMITNIPLRGLWSLVAIISLVTGTLFISLFGWWDDIFHALDGLHIYINMAGYLFLSTVLAIGWFITFYIFDKRNYMIFTPGQIKVCEQVGGREKVYDTTGMTIEKHRDDWFRHIFLGFGSGDLSVRTAGADRHELLMPNVSFIGFKIGPIEQLLREKQMVKSS
jgi:hypothetical protein